MFNKAERARRVVNTEAHERAYRAFVQDIPDRAHDEASLEALNARARFHRKQAELWAKSVRAFDDAALRTAKLVGRK